MGTDDEFYTSDQEDDYSIEGGGLENDESDTQWIPPKGTTTKVVHLYLAINQDELNMNLSYSITKKNLIFFEFWIFFLGSSCMDIGI